jgi:hypothetical protein
VLDDNNRCIRFDVIDGAQFLQSDELIDNDIVELIALLAKLMTYPFLDCTDKKLNEQAIPGILADICRGSHFDGGERLTKQANRHAMDPRTHLVIDEKGAIRCVDGKVCLEIDGHIHASMKNDDYSTRVAISLDGLVACACSCKVGSYGDQRVACVHSPAKILQFAHLCLDGFVKHALVELAARWSSVPKSFDSDTKQQLTTNFRQLMGVVKPDEYCRMPSDNETLESLLHNIAVGTEVCKKSLGPPPSDHVYKPLRTYHFTSSEKRGLNLVAEKLGNKKECKEKQENLPTDESLWDPDYERVVSAIDTLYVLIAKKNGWEWVLIVRVSKIEMVVLA